MWVGHAWEALYTKHSQGQKVKGQGHKVMRRSSTKTSNISNERHSVVEMHKSNRKSRSPERMAGSDFWPEVPKQLFLRIRGENMPKTRLRCCQIATILVRLWEIVVAEHDGESSF